MGMLNTREWKAKWIGAPWQGEDALPKPKAPNASLPEILPPPAPIFRRPFSVSKEVAEAVVYVTGLGYFELYLNGQKVGNDVLVPNQTNYGKRPDLKNQNIPLDDNFREYKVMYLAYDIKDKLQKGENVIGSILGNGFYNPAKYWADGYGTPRFLAQVHIKYADGTVEMICTDERWKVSESPILMDMVYYGEHYDARKEQLGWCSAGFDDSKWVNAVFKNSPYGKLKAHMANPDKVMEILQPKIIQKIGEGHYRIDFGEEISGWVHLKDISGAEGHKIDINYIHRSRNGENSYVLSGKSPESYAARFTWFVFREVEIVNWPGELSERNITAEAVYTQIEQTAEFKCSNKLFEDIVKIWQRSQRDNMHGGIPSDCPNRERSPYTGDGQVACGMVMHNFDSRSFYTKWIYDIIGSENIETGYVPNSAPWQSGSGGGPAWGAAIAVIPWEFYLHYGDITVLKNSFPGMKNYIGYMLKWVDKEGVMYFRVLKENGQPLRWFNLGDWNAPGNLPPDNLVHTFYLWHCAKIASSTAKILGDNAASEFYENLSQRTHDAFIKRFYDESSGSFGAFGGNIFALFMGLPENLKGNVISALKNDLQLSDGHLDTGIFGTRFFFEVLSENGLHELAYQAMNKRTAPSYGWWLEQGATTTWEGWHRPGSGNHPMFGGGLAWLYKNLAGMNYDPEKPGYKHVVFKPMPVKDVATISYSNQTPYGICSISWKIEDADFCMSVTVPVGSDATVYIPCKNIRNLYIDNKNIRRNKDINFLQMENDCAVLSIPSGSYNFLSSQFRKQ